MRKHTKDILEANRARAYTPGYMQDVPAEPTPRRTCTPPVKRFGPDAPARHTVSVKHPPLAPYRYYRVTYEYQGETGSMRIRARRLGHAMRTAEERLCTMLRREGDSEPLFYDFVSIVRLMDECPQDERPATDEVLRGKQP